MKKPAEHRMTFHLGDGSTQVVLLFIDHDAARLKKRIADVGGFDPIPFYGYFWLDSEHVANIALLSPASGGTIIHESLHAAVACTVDRGMNPNDGESRPVKGLTKPVVPADVCANLAEQLVARIKRHMSSYRRRRD